jgi:hypothetical protein
MSAFEGITYARQITRDSPKGAHERKRSGYSVHVLPFLLDEGKIRDNESLMLSPRVEDEIWNTLRASFRPQELRFFLGA